MRQIVKRVLFGGGVLLLGTAFSVPAHAQQPAGTQTAGSTQGGHFEPLERWAAAVLSGDKAALAGFYLSGPGTFAKIPEGKNTEPATEEPQFWSSLAANGLIGIIPKILQEETPQPGMVSLTLRVEMTFHAKDATQENFVSTAQVWVETDTGWRIAITQRGKLVASPVLRLPEPATPNTHLYDDPADAQKDLDAALACAKGGRKRVLVVFGANWCFDCHVLDAAFHSAEITPLIADNYCIAHINIGDGNSNTDLAKRFGVPLEKGIPGLAVLDADGSVVTSQKQGEFESAAKIGMTDVTQFLLNWKPPAVK
ncbi:MAG: thioredoxin family protein [Candidatus Acidiferrales bacterium]